MKKSIWPVLGLVGVVLVAGCVSSGTVKPTSEEEMKLKRQEAEKNYSIGASYYAQRSYDAAMENFQRAIETDPTYYDPYIGVGNIWRFRRDPIQAQEYYRKAMKLDPKKAKAYEGLGDLFLEMSGMDSTYVDSALAVYKSGLEQDSSLVDLYNGVAEIYVRMGKTAQADSVYKEALRRFPDEISVQRLWAEFLYKQQRYQEAADVLRPLIERFQADPNVNKLREKLAAALTELGKYEEAITVLAKVLETDSSNVQAVLTQGVILTRQGKYKQAIQKFDWVIGRDSTNALAYVYKADAQIKQQSFSSAESNIRLALKYDPTMVSAYSYLGDIRRIQGDQNRGKIITATPTKRLEQAKTDYENARSFYQQALGDPSFGSYCRQQIDYLNKTIDAVEKELFIRH